jgi:hypothetical protein
MRWFGESWGAPVCEDTAHADTPVGEECDACPEPIEGDDQGFLLPFYDTDAVSEIAYHRGCLMGAILGPDYTRRFE